MDEVERMVLNITDQNFKAETSNGVVLVDFWAPWCGPCRMQGPILEELDKELAGKATIVKVDVDSNQVAPAQYGVMSIPTLIVLKDGQLVEKMVGVQSKVQLQNILSKHM